MFTQAVKNVLEFTQEKLLKHYSISQSSWFSWVSAATAARSGYRDRPLRSGVPGHLLSCLTPLICMGLFLPNKNLNLLLSVPSTILQNPHLYFLLHSHKQAPNSLLFPPGLCFCCIMSGLIPEHRSLRSSKAAAMFDSLHTLWSVKLCSSQNLASIVRLLTFLGSSPFLGVCFL